jgi:hypothetical protein
MNSPRPSVEAAMSDVLDRLSRACLRATAWASEHATPEVAGMIVELSDASGAAIAEITRLRERTE